MSCRRRSFECRAVTEEPDVIGHCRPVGARKAVSDEEEHIHHHGDEKSKTVLSGKFHIVLAELGGNPVLTEILSKMSHAFRWSWRSMRKSGRTIAVRTITA